MNRTDIELLTDFIVESDAIERITADRELVRLQLQEGIRAGHAGALLLLERRAARKKTLLTEAVVQKVQGLITAEQHTKPGGPRLRSEWIGRYRSVNVSVGGRAAPPAHRVPGLMRAWVGGVAKWQEEYTTRSSGELRRIATFHFEYERIHPFADGNGRSGRAIVYYLMRYARMKPFVFSSADRFETYYRCFQDVEIMCQYFGTRAAAG